MEYDNKISNIIRDLPRSGIRDFFELVIGRTDVISLGVGEPDKPTPWPIREAVIRSLEKARRATPRTSVSNRCASASASM